MANDVKGYPKKYWWLILVALPIILGLIAVLPGLIQRSDKAGAAGSGVSQSGSGNVAQTGSGNVNISNSDLSSKMYVTNVSIIASEYAKYQGQPLNDDELKRQIERAVAEANEGKHAESIRLLEELARKVPLPAIYNNLGVEYAKAGQTEAAQKAFNQAIEKDPSHQEAKKNLELLTSRAPRDAPKNTGPAIKVEPSTVATVVVDPLDDNQDAVKEIHLVDSGTKLESYYNVKYKPQLGSPMIVEPGRYDVVFKTTGDGTFVLTRNVEVKEGTRVRINPNALLGNIFVEPLTRKGFPEIKELTVFEAGTTGYRLIVQRTDRLGVALPIVPGTYDLQGKTAEGGEFVFMKNVELKARETRRISANDEVAAIIVHDPKIAGSKVEEVYVLQTGTNNIVAKTDGFDRPMMVVPGESYDVALKQPGGVAKIKNKIVPKRGELIEVP